MNEVFAWSGVVLGLALLALLVQDAVGQAAAGSVATQPPTRRRYRVGVLGIVVLSVVLTLGPRLVSLLV